MKELKLGKHKVEIYDSIEDLPMQRFHKYNKMLLVDAGIGSDMADFDRHIEKALVYNRQRKNDLAAVELDNMRQNVYFIQQGISPKHLAFAVLVRKLDGEECNDLSDDGLAKIVDRLSDVSVKEMTSSSEEVKKKIDDELRLYFPSLFDDVEVKEYYDLLRRRTLAVLQGIITNKDTSEVDTLTDMLMTYNAPHTFNGKDSVEIDYDKQFDRMCLIISQQLNVNPKQYTVMEYYNAYEYIREMARKARKGK